MLKTVLICLFISLLALPVFGQSVDTAWVKINPDSIPFASAVSYAAGPAPSSVFCADLDGDGDLDLAVADELGFNVSILKNNGDGTFQTAVGYPAGDGPTSVFSADLDGDGDLDLAVADIGIARVSILKNNGDGTFQAPVNYPAGITPCSIFSADLDADGDMDLAVANSNSSSVSILKNNGDGTFQTAVSYVTGMYPTSVFCADLDGDGYPDLAVANELGFNVSILKNNGDGTFKTAINYACSRYPTSVFCADLDGDGYLDLAVANGNSNNVSTLKNNGDGTFQTAVNYPTGIVPRSVFSADLDGDGDMDLVVANSNSSSVSILKNNGDGTFQSAVNYGAGDDPRSVFCADLDGDGDLDLAVANFNSNNVSILKNLTQIPANQPLRPFSLISPLDGDTTFGSTTFRWQIPYDPNFGDQIRYDLYVSKVPGFDPDSTIIYDSLTLSKFKASQGLGTYNWKVKAYDHWGAEKWSTQVWSFVQAGLPETLWYVAYCPVDLIVTAPNGDSIGVNFNTIPKATYDTTTDWNHDGRLDNIVTIPNPIIGEYQVRVFRKPVVPPGDTSYSLGIRIDSNNEVIVVSNAQVPGPGQIDTVVYAVMEYLRGDPNRDGNKTVSDIIYIINYLFRGGPPPNPVKLGNVNYCQCEVLQDCDGKVTVADVVYLVNYLFKGGPPPCS